MKGENGEKELQKATRDVFVHKILVLIVAESPSQQCEIGRNWHTSPLEL